MARFKSAGYRKLLEARISEAENAGHSGRAALIEGGERFLQDIKEQLGLMVRSNPQDPNSPLVESLDDYDRPMIAPNALSASSFSIGELAEGICGRQWVESLDPQNGNNGLHSLTEAAIDPTAFINVNLLSVATGGLVQARILERFKNAVYIGEQIVEVIPTNKNGEKLIGAGAFSSTDGDQERKPGQKHARAQFGERYVTTPETKEKGLACEVLKETIFFDQTGVVLQEAGEVGDILAYGKEKDILDVVIGATNPYIYNGTGYSTFQTSTPWVNKVDNTLVDYDNLDVALNLFTKMTNPETGREIIISPDTIIHVPRRNSKWEQTLYPNFIRTVTNTNTTTEAKAPTSTTTNYNRLQSQILYNRLVAASVDATKALEYWWLLEKNGAFCWMENWPLTVKQAVANDWALQDSGIVFANLANHRGICTVKEPRKVVLSYKA